MTWLCKGLPVETVGRMARFELSPGKVTQEEITSLLGLFFEATYADADKCEQRYGA